MSSGFVAWVRRDADTFAVAEAVVKALEEAWLSVSPYATSYFH